MNETKKMLEIIHTNRQKVYEAKLEKQVKEKKEDRKFKTILCVTCFTAILLILVGISHYNNKQIAKCMESGKSETFCTYAGE